eukprot:maker-scaffold_37-snap-gene-1.46-mRNA-1 protein AED:0.00 eAED:0.00 QI:151/1/1/1/1/1/2/145/385
MSQFNLILSTLLTTLEAIITVIMVYCSGFILVKLKKINAHGVQLISQVSSNLFIPSLLFIRLGGTLSLDMLIYAYKLPLIGTFIVFYNYSIAKYILLPLANPPENIRVWFILGQTITNYVSIPLILLTSICSQISFPKSKFFSSINKTEYFTAEECLETAELYIFVMSFVSILLLFSFGWIYAENQVIKTTKGINEVPSRTIYDLILLILNRPINSSQLLGISIGLISPIQTFLFATLEPLTSGVRIISRAATPTINVIMSCTLALRVETFDKLSDILNKEKIGVEKRTILVYAFGRMVFVPAITFPWMYILGDIIFPDDDLMKLVVYLELFIPSANFTVVLAQMLKLTEVAETMAVGALLQYLIGIVSITFYGFLVIYLLGLEI